MFGTDNGMDKPCTAIYSAGWKLVTNRSTRGDILGRAVGKFMAGPADSGAGKNLSPECGAVFSSSRA